MNILKYRYCIIGTALIVFDRFSKLWAEGNLGVPKDITSFLSFELAHNTGVSFSLFAEQSASFYWLLTIAIGILLFFFARLMVTRSKEGYSVIGQVLVVAGGFGNLCDRIWYRYVIDFIYFHYKTWSYPHFNIADICIVLGVFLIVSELFLQQKHESL